MLYIKYISIKLWRKKSCKQEKERQPTEKYARHLNMHIQMARKYVGKKGSTSLEIKEPQIKTRIQYP